MLAPDKGQALQHVLKCEMLGDMDDAPVVVRKPGH